jgi:protein phosphatase
MNLLKYNGYGLSHKGYVRLKNEDAYLVDNQFGCFVVADGLGGHPGGEIASHLAVSAFQQEVIARKNEGVSFNEGNLIELVELLNQIVLDYGLQQPEVRGLGCTFTGLLVEGDTIWILHTGDSRIYGLTQKRNLIQLTEDQTVAMELVNQGKLDITEAEKHPQWHILTSCLGMTKCKPEVQSLKATGYMYFLLCTDGLTNLVPASEIQEQLVEREFIPEVLCQRLVDRALIRGGVDNVTVVLVTFK